MKANLLLLFFTLAAGTLTLTRPWLASSPKRLDRIRRLSPWQLFGTWVVLVTLVVAVYALGLPWPYGFSAYAVMLGFGLAVSTLWAPPEDWDR